MNDELKKKTVDKVTTPVYQVLNNLDLLEIVDEPEVIKGLLADSKRKLVSAVDEYVQKLGK